MIYLLYIMIHYIIINSIILLLDVEVLLGISTSTSTSLIIPCIMRSL